MRALPKLPHAEVSAADLQRKYAQILALRRASEPASRDVLRALAREFPGALRELDALPLDEVTGRVEALAGVVDLHEGPAWARWLAAYHGLMRLTLALKLALSARGAQALADAQSFADAADARWGHALGVDFVRAVHAPPRGRLGVVVFAALGARFGEDPAHIWQTLFPTARRDRFAPAAGR